MPKKWPGRPRPLLGRDQELAKLYALVDGIEEQGGALVVRGEAGIGKSAVLAAARERRYTRASPWCPRQVRSPRLSSPSRGFYQLLLPLLGGLDLLPDPQRRALETAFGIAEGDAPDLFLIQSRATPIATHRCGSRGKASVSRRQKQVLAAQFRCRTSS